MTLLKRRTTDFEMETLKKKLLPLKAVNRMMLKNNELRRVFNIQANRVIKETLNNETMKQIFGTIAVCSL